MSDNTNANTNTKLPSFFGRLWPLPTRRTSPQVPQVIEPGSLSQIGLIRRAFVQHKLAMIGLHVLALLYAAAIFAEFVATRPPNERNVDYLHCPPTAIGFDFEHGLHVEAIRQIIDPATLRVTYERTGEATPLDLLAKPQTPQPLWGIVPMPRQLVGLEADHGKAAFYPLGADQFGRCIFSRIVHGARVSLSVGLLGVAMTFVLGTLVGGVSGYLGGTVDTLIQRTIEIVNAVPSLPLWIALAAAMPADWSPLRTYFAITVVLSLLGWTGLARVVRGKILGLREEDYAVAARLLGASGGRILVRHLLPGFTSHIIVALTLSVPGMILGETALSFLGLGLRPPVVSWGVMLQDCLDVKAVRFFPWLLLPSLFIIVTVLAFNFVGDGLRDAADPYSTK